MKLMNELVEKRTSLFHFPSKEYSKVKIVKIMKYTSLLINKWKRKRMNKDMLINNGETTGKRRFNGGLSEILAKLGCLDDE